MSDITDDTYHVNYLDVGSISDGGLFVKLGWGNDYANIVEVIDLASATGAKDMVLIEQGTAVLNPEHQYPNDPPRSEFARLRAAWRRVMSSCGPLDTYGFKVTGIDRPTLRRMLFAACWQYGSKDTDKSVVLYNADGSECANCGEAITYRDGRCEHVDSIHGLTNAYLPCVPEDASEIANVATPKAPVAHENGNESWPELLAEDWQDYADGDAGVWRYLSDAFEIDKPENS